MYWRFNPIVKSCTANYPSPLELTSKQPENVKPNSFQTEGGTILSFFVSEMKIQQCPLWVWVLASFICQAYTLSCRSRTFCLTEILWALWSFSCYSRPLSNTPGNWTCIQQYMFLNCWTISAIPFPFLCAGRCLVWFGFDLSLLLENNFLTLISNANCTYCNFH